MANELWLELCNGASILQQRWIWHSEIHKELIKRWESKQDWIFMYFFKQLVAALFRQTKVFRVRQTCLCVETRQFVGPPLHHGLLTKWFCWATVQKHHTTSCCIFLVILGIEAYNPLHHSLVRTVLNIRLGIMFILDNSTPQD